VVSQRTVFLNSPKKLRCAVLSEAQGTNDSNAALPFSAAEGRLALPTI